jgi:AhpC/TSA antioxidant enzyme
LYPEYFGGFDIFGIVKETGVDDDGLIDFYRNYFSYPLYRDTSYSFYQALGDYRKVGFESIIVPLGIYSWFCDTWFRITRQKKNTKIKGLSNRGEGLVFGGIIIFKENTLEPVAMLQEQLGVDLAVLDIVQALDYIRQQQQQLHKEG